MRLTEPSPEFESSEVLHSAALHLGEERGGESREKKLEDAQEKQGSNMNREEIVKKELQLLIKTL